MSTIYTGSAGAFSGANNAPQLTGLRSRLISAPTSIDPVAAGIATDVVATGNWEQIVSIESVPTIESLSGDTGTAIVASPGAGISFVDKATATAQNSPLTLVVPVDTLAGQLAIVAITWNAGVPVTPPAGWAAVPNGSISQVGNQQTATWFRILTSGDPGFSYSWTFASEPLASGIMLIYSGASATNPIDVAAGSTGSAIDNATPTAPSIVTRQVNDRLIVIYGLGAGMSRLNASLTDRADDAVVSGVTWGETAADVQLGASGATATYPSTTAAAYYWTAISIAIAPASVFDNAATGDVATGTLSGQVTGSATDTVATGTWEEIPSIEGVGNIEVLSGDDVANGATGAALVDSAADTAATGDSVDAHCKRSVNGDR